MHRIEAGNPSVTIGAYSNVAAALGLHLVVPILDAPSAEPAMITAGDYPGLRTLVWQTDAGTTITETEALNLYERGWRHLDQETLTAHETAFIQHLADTYSNGRLLVQAAAPPTGGRGAVDARRTAPGRTPSVDGYGIRTSVLVAGLAIKFEIRHEGRIDLDTPSPKDQICGVRILTRTDQVASKLLANDDRWADTSTFGRDLIDLAMMKPGIAALKAGAGKAVDAYGKTVGESFNNAVAHLRKRPHRLGESIRALKIDAPRAVVWQAIRDLSTRCAKIEALSAG